MRLSPILIVDDEADLEALIRQKYRRDIRSGNRVFHFARDGIQALEILRSTPNLYLVLSDINMPNMDGLTLLSHIQSDFPLVKTVMVSAYGDMGNIRSAMNNGAFDFVTKPIDFQDLDRTIEKAESAIEEALNSVDMADRLDAIGQDLAIAARIQSSFLPSQTRDMQSDTRFEIAGHSTPSKTVGGDFYDYFMIDQDRIGFVIADVSGKGIPAAIFMAVSRTVLRSLALQGLPPEEVLSRTNDTLVLDNDACMFVTVCYAILDLPSGVLHIARAGHPAPLRSFGSTTELLCTQHTGIVLGALDDAEFESESVQLSAGDMILLYTDGVTEAQNNADSLFGDDALMAHFSKHSASSPVAYLDRLRQSVSDFEGDTEQSDDITLLAIRYQGGE